MGVLRSGPNARRCGRKPEPFCHRAGAPAWHDSGMAEARTLSTDCCVVGGGPAGMLLALLLARTGARVTVLEKHADFLRDFRGDTVHPSTLEVLDQIGLMERFAELPHRRERELSVQFADGMLAVADFGRLERYPYLAFVPQWDFLDLLASEARRFDGFELRMRSEAQDLLFEGDVVAGVRAKDDQGDLSVRAKIVVAADGRNSVLREAAGFHPVALGAPMDVLWFRLPRAPQDPDASFGIAGRGQLLAVIHRGDYWQIGFIVAKSAVAGLRTAPIESFQATVARAAPVFADRARVLSSWEAVKRLEVRVDYLKRWFRPGLLFIGDAAHAMSPIGGVGINLAIQDAVAAANALGPALRAGQVPGSDVLAQVQKRRQLPARLIQTLQVFVQRVVIARALGAAGDPPRAPRLLRALLRLRAVRSIPARVFGLGFRRERVAFTARQS